jgi:hypothetical protein
MEQLQDVAVIVSSEGIVTVKRLLPQWQLAGYVTSLFGLRKASKSGMLAVKMSSFW